MGSSENADWIRRPGDAERPSAQETMTNAIQERLRPDYGKGHAMRGTPASRPESVIGPLGQPLTLASLPPTNTKRWIAHRKAELVAAVHGGLLTVEEVCERYGIDLEEFVSWQRGVDRLGMRGLWVTRTQKHRDYFERMDRY